MDWDDVSKPKADEIVVGQSLERLSLDDLAARLTALRREIERVEQEITRKKSIGASADAVFKS